MNDCWNAVKIEATVVDGAENKEKRRASDINYAVFKTVVVAIDESSNVQCKHPYQHSCGVRVF